MYSVKYLIGIDEVGRGALAGPVVVAAFAVPVGRKFNFRVKDSKALTPIQREGLLKWIKKTGFVYSIARVCPNIIDKINISKAANLAAYRALKRLIKKLDIDNSHISVYLDGGLYLKNKDYQVSEIKSGLKVKTVIRGDQKFNSVKLASVVAKVNRDHYMVKLHDSCPGYEFNIHKGYGTKAHIRAIRKYGLSDMHRLTFVKKYHKMK